MAMSSMDGRARILVVVLCFVSQEGGARCPKSVASSVKAKMLV
jgi:hypothetical protein